MLTAPDPLPDDVTTLQALVTALVTRLGARERALQARDQMIETLKAQLAVLRRRQFGQHSEKLGRTADQLELQSEELEQRQAEWAAAAEAGAPTSSDTAQPAKRRRPVRQPLPASLPRENEELTPPYAACPGCGGALRRLGEDISEVLEVVPARLRVRRYVCPVWPAAAVATSARHRRRRCHCRRAMPVPACWPRSYWPSTTITCRPTVRPNASPARAWRCRARP